MKCETIDRRPALHQLSTLFCGRKDRKVYSATHPSLGTADLKRHRHGWMIKHSMQSSGYWRSIKELKSELSDRGYTKFTTIIY